MSYLFKNNNGSSIELYEQLEMPDLAEGKTAIWRKTDAYNRVFLLQKIGGFTYFEELTDSSPSPIPEPMLIETFETNWFINNNFSNLFNENFEGVW